VEERAQAPRERGRSHVSASIPGNVRTLYLARSPKSVDLQQVGCCLFEERTSR
jgi:hypothetical protein